MMIVWGIRSTIRGSNLIAIAMFVTFLVGLSRVFLGVHYPSDVVAGWLIGMSWAMLCWAVERTVERRAGLKREKEEVR